MADHDPRDETVIRNPVDVVAAVFDLEPFGISDGILSQDDLDDLLGIGTPLADEEAALVAAPAVSLSPQEIAELRPTAAEVAFGRQFAIGAETLAHLLDAIEALTAENARLTSERDMLRDAVAEGGAIIEAMRAEVERLRAMLPPEPTDHRPLTEVFAELRAIVAEADMQELADFGQRHQPESYATTDHGWYTAHRRRVEADHAAAKAPAATDAAFAAVVSRQIDRPERADRLWDAPMEDVIAALRPALVKGGEAESPLTPGEALAPLRDAYPPPRLDDDGIPESPLSHPRYPDLVKMARESSKDGD